MERRNNGRTLWKTENKSNEFVIPQKHCERHWSVAKYFSRAQELPVLFSPPDKTFLWERIFSVRNLKDFQGICHSWRLYWWRTLAACKEGIPLIPCCSWILRMGVSPLSVNVWFVKAVVSSGPPWERPGELVGLTAQLQRHCNLQLSHRLVACPASSTFILTPTERKEEWVLLAKVQASKVKLRGLGEPMILNKSGVFVSSHRVWISNWVQLYKCLPLWWPWCVLWESTIQAVLHVTSLVSHFFWNKSKYGAVPSAKWSLWFLLLPKRGRGGPRPGCLCHIAELALPLIFRHERGEFRVQPTLQHIQSSTPDDFSKQ